MPAQLVDHAETLRTLGLALDPSALTDPAAAPLSAIVSLGGCSASFVSPDGLIITNHHCVGRFLQVNSTPADNLMTRKFLAEDRAHEKPGDPASRVFVTTRFHDVTADVLAHIDEIRGDTERSIEKTRRQDALRRTCETGKVGVRCTIASFFEGAQYFEIEQVELKDIRLVYAPHPGVGVFGGEVDNWRWPRHTGDWAFLRAYVGKDGRPAEFAADNVPYHPKYHLSIAEARAEADDLVMVAGYPAQTHRLKMAAQVRDATEWTYPYLIERYEATIALLESKTKGNEALAIKYAGQLRGLHNYLTNYRGMLEGLTERGVADQKAAAEGKLRTWIAGDPARSARFAEPLRELDALNERASKTRVEDSHSTELLGASPLLTTANTIVDWAIKRDLREAERPPGYRDSDRKRIETTLQSMAQTFDPGVDRALLELALTRALRLPPAEQPKLLSLLLTAGLDQRAVTVSLDRLYAATTLTNLETRLALLRTATLAELRASRDPFIQVALALKPYLDAKQDEAEARDGTLALLVPRYIEAVRAFNSEQGLQTAPEANRTLRVSYGTIKGYRPNPQAPVYDPFTTVSQMVAKNTGEPPFDAPPPILEAATRARTGKTWGPYVNDAYGEVTLDFLADLDITGGNSGSATLNERGELVGLAFDGNYESIASDWVFMPEVTRSIHVDIRYVMWVMDAVDDADHLLEEMGVRPTLD